LNRVVAAPVIASWTARPSLRSRPAKSISGKPCDTTMPTKKITPISDCTLRLVRVDHSTASTPISPRGTVAMMIMGVRNDRISGTMSR